jgi:hypothetical protein
MESQTSKIFGRTLGKIDLFRLKFKAIRCGIWFRALSRIDRALVDLTMNVVNCARSRKLVSALLSVVTKLEDALENRVFQAVNGVGLELSRKLSRLAQNWGNKSASNWADDRRFARFLAIMYINGYGATKL